MIANRLPCVAIVAAAFLLSVVPARLRSAPALPLDDPYGNTGVRETAMANTGLSDATDITSLFTNAAGLAFARRHSIFTDYAYAPVGNSTTFALGIPLIDEGKYLSLGFLLHRANSVPAIADSAQFPNTYRIDLASSYPVTYTFSVGVRLAALYSRNDRSRAWSGFGSFGLYYAPSPSITYAFVYDGAGAGPWRPVSGALAVPPDEIPRSFQIGVTMRYPSSYAEHFISFSAANEKIVGRSGLLYKGGIEVTPWQFLNLRAGIIIGPSSSAGRYGINFTTQHLQVGYALVPGKDLGPVHEISLLLEP